MVTVAARPEDTYKSRTSPGASVTIEEPANSVSPVRLSVFVTERLSIGVPFLRADIVTEVASEPEEVAL
jgi:hypothetical protein